MTEDEAEEAARQASEESGLDDRPRCDPRVLAAGYLGLELLPWPRTPPRLVDGVIWYPSEAREDAIAYYVAHECGHELVRGERLEGDLLERVRPISRDASDAARSPVSMTCLCSARIRDRTSALTSSSPDIRPA